MITPLLISAFTFSLVATYPGPAIVTIMHSDQVRVRAPECWRIDDWVDRCDIRNPDTVLTIAAPCWMGRIELVTSARHVESNFDNRRFWADNPTRCPASVYIPIAAR